MKFAKYHGLGNDYLVIEPSAWANADFVELAPRICHRNYGLGGDGILLGPLPSARAEFGLRIINPDGSEAEKSGNGLRIFARYLWDTGRVRQEPFRIETKGGIAPAQLFPEAGAVRVGMGRASFDSEVVGDRRAPPRSGWRSDAARRSGPELLGGERRQPPLRDFGSAGHRGRGASLGPLVEADARFRNRTNVQLLEVVDRSNIQIQIWERGAGYTLASGSSASAAACAAKRLGLCGAQVTVHMPGGQLSVEIDEAYGVTQTGPATRVAEGEIARECLSPGAAWTRA